MSSFTGRCLCGAVQYTCSVAPMISGHCQCEDCRRASGSGHSSHMMVPRSAVTLSGAVTAYERTADSGNRVTRAFCPVCGAPVYSLNDSSPDTMVLRASTLDDLSVFQPIAVVYASRAAPWDVIDPDLMRFDAMPPMGPAQLARR